MTNSPPGNYPIETRDGEIERLHVQGAAMAPDCEVMLDRIGVGDGWRCLDVGCGPGGITDLLGKRVGANGRVLGIDRNAAFLAEARKGAAGNVAFELGDIYETGLATECFDLVHMRFVASTAGEPERLLAEAKRLVRPGGVVALQEPDGSTLNCWPPHPAWDRLKAALLGVFECVGADLTLARRLYSLVRASGLSDLQYRTFIVAVRAGDPMVDYLPSTIESVSEAVVRLGLVSADELAQLLAACRAHLRRPDTSFTMYTVAQVWGRKQGSRHSNNLAQ